MPKDNGADGNNKGWQPELDELRERERLRTGNGRPRQGAPPARWRPAHHPRADRKAGRSRLAARGRRHRRRAPAMTSENRLQTLHAVEPDFRPRDDRRPAGHHLGRRLHRARRLGRCHHPGEDRHCRAHGQRAAPAHHPHRRGLGRRRLGQDHRDHGPRQSAGRPRRLLDALQVHDRQSGARAGGRARPRLGRRPRRRAGGGQPLLDDDQVDLGDVRGGAAGGRAHRRQAEPRQAAARRLGDPVRGRRHRRCRGQRGGGVRARTTLPVLSAVVCLWRVAARGPRTDAPGRREERLFTAVPRDRNQPYKMRPIIAAMVDRELVLRDGRALRPPRHHRPRASRRPACRASWPAIRST